MSEPSAAFLRLQIDRPPLSQWLASAPSPASIWGDWDRLAGTYWRDGGGSLFRDYPADEQTRVLASADGIITGHSSIYDALIAVIATRSRDSVPYVDYDDGVGTLDLGQMMFGENLGGFIFFLSLARSSAAYIGEGAGMAAITSGFFGPTAGGAVRIGPGPVSEVLSPDAVPSAQEAFAPLSRRIIDLIGTEPPAAIGQAAGRLDALR